MRLLVKIGLATFAIFFIITFVVAALRLASDLGTGSTYYIVQDGLFMLAGGIGFIGCLMKSRKLEQKYKAELEAEQFAGNGFEADVRKSMIMLAAALALFSLWVIYLMMAESPINRRVLVPAVAFLMFSMLMLSAILSLFRSGKPSLVMDTFALDHVWYGPIRWGQIQGIHLREIRARGTTKHSLALLVEKPGRYLTQLPWWLRVLISAKRRNAVSGTIEIPLGALNKSALMTHKAAVALRSRVSPPPLSFWVPGLSAEAIGLQREMDIAFRRIDEIGQSVEQDRLTPEQLDSRLKQVTADMERKIASFRELGRGSNAGTILAMYVMIISSFGLILYVLYVLLRMFFPGAI